MSTSTGRVPTPTRMSSVNVWLCAVAGSGLATFTACWMYSNALFDLGTEDMAGTMFLLWVFAFVVQCLCACVADTVSNRLETDNGTLLLMAVVASALVCGMIFVMTTGQRYGVPWYTDYSVYAGAVFLAVYAGCLWRARRWHSD